MRVYKILLCILWQFSTFRKQRTIKFNLISMTELIGSTTRACKSLISRPLPPETLIRSPGIAKLVKSRVLSSNVILLKYIWKLSRCFRTKKKRYMIVVCILLLIQLSWHKIFCTYIFSFLICLRKSPSTSIL